MKNIIQRNLIPSLAVIGSCLALSQIAQAEPAFYGTLTIDLDGDIVAMGGATLGESSMVMLPATGEVVGESAGDFNALKIKNGNAVAFSATTLTPGETEMFTFAADSGLSVASYSVMFSSTGPDHLHIEAPVVVRDMSKPEYGTAAGVLEGDFISNAKGVVSGSFTINIPLTRETEESLERTDALRREDAVRRPDALRREDAVRRPDALRREDAVRRPDALRREDAVRRPDALKRGDN